MLFLPYSISLTAIITFHLVQGLRITSNDTHPSSVLLQHGTVITYNISTSSIQVLRNSSVLIRDDRIVSIGGTFSDYDLAGTEIIDVEGMIVSPGFVDTHRHGWQTAWRTIGSNTTLTEYFFRYGESSQALKYFTPDDVYIGQLTGLYEALNAGVTSILDHAHHTWSTETSIAGLQASVDSGARVWWSYSVHRVPNNYDIDSQLTDFASLASDERGIWKGSAVSVGLAYDRFDSAPPSEVNRVLDLARNQNVSVISTHYVGAPFGADNSVNILDSYSVLNSSIPLVIAHASGLTQSEALLLRKYNQFISITPESEHHYGHDNPHSHQILDQSALGVDTHFTFSTDLVTQARLWLQVVRLRLYRAVLADWEAPANNPMSVNQAFLLATRNGGLALRRDDIGVIAPGAKADVVVFKGDSPGMLGWEDPVAAIILHSNVGDIQHVLVDGKFVKRDGSFVNVDWNIIKSRFLTSAKRIQKIWSQLEYPPHSGEFSPGINYENVEIADAVRGAGSGY